jgi:hypothetical protein
MRTKISVGLLLAGAACVAAASGAAQSSQGKTSAARVYVAQLHALNSKATGKKVTGTARFTVRGDSLTIAINVQNAPAGIEHLQHFHGFTDGRDATCAAPSADVNHDGVVDLIETEPTSGTTMVPFTDDPVRMEIVTDTYPKANSGGAYHYSKTVSLSALEKAFSEKFSGQTLDLGQRVVYIHGVPSDTELPSTAASLGTIPAQVTIPIACGKIEAAGR